MKIINENCWLKNYLKEDHRSYRCNFCSCEKKAWKKFRLIRISNTWPLWYSYSTLTNWANKPTGSRSLNWFVINLWKDDDQVMNIWKSYIYIKLVWNCNSNEENHKYNSKILTVTWPSLQYAKWLLLKFRLGTYILPLIGPQRMVLLSFFGTEFGLQLFSIVMMILHVLKPIISCKTTKLVKVTYSLV